MLDHYTASNKRYRFFQKSRKGRYARAIEDDPRAVELYEQRVQERLERGKIGRDITTAD